MGGSNISVCHTTSFIIIFTILLNTHLQQNDKNILKEGEEGEKDVEVRV